MSTISSYDFKPHWTSNLVVFGFQLNHLHSNDYFHLCFVNVRALYGRKNSVRLLHTFISVLLICVCSCGSLSVSLSMHVRMPKCVCLLSSILLLTLICLFHFIINKFNKLIKKSFFWYLAGAMHKLNGKLIQLDCCTIIDLKWNVAINVMVNGNVLPNWFLSFFILFVSSLQNGFSFMFLFSVSFSIQTQLNCTLSMSKTNFIKEMMKECNESEYTTLHRSIDILRLSIYIVMKQVEHTLSCLQIFYFRVFLNSLMSLQHYWMKRFFCMRFAKLSANASFVHQHIAMLVGNTKINKQTKQ